MPENFTIKYFYTSEILSKAASDHVFRYLSAFSGYKFIEDKNEAVIWRGVENNIPACARIVLGNERDSEDSPFVQNRDDEGRVYITPDPIERIYKKISIKAILGPYSKSEHMPLNDPDESLGEIIKSFFNRLRDNNIIQSKEGEITLWPEGYNFAITVTHDVDIARRSIRGSIRLLFKRDVPGGLKGLFDSFKPLLGLGKNPYDKITEWVDFEKRAGIRSTFFIFPGNGINKNDPKYKLNKLKKSIEYIGENRYELGLHTGIECYRGDSIAKSKDVLNQASGISVSGIRPHYLSASLPDYWRAAAENGFEYSSCLGFDEAAGFYQGIDLPFMPFDAGSDIALDIVEIPIAIMDCGLIGDYSSNQIESLENGKRLIDRVKSARGILVLDWHQRTMYNTDYPGWTELFFNLVNYARTEGAYFISPGETAELLKSKMAGSD